MKGRPDDKLKNKQHKLKAIESPLNREGFLLP